MKTKILIFLILALAVHHGTVVANQALGGQTEELGNLIIKLSNRVEYLETRDKMQEKLIESLHQHSLSRDKEQTRVIESLQQQIHSQDERIALLEQQNIALKTLHEPYTRSNADENPTSANADDISFLQTIPKEKQNVDRIKKGVNLIPRAENEQPIAFFAAANAHINHLGTGQVLLFDNITTNIGNAFHVHIGSFLAPVDGIYVFSASIVSQNHHDGHVDFTKNGQFVSRMFVQGSVSGFDSTSKTVVIQLNKDDDVNIRSVDADASFQGDSHSSFAGFLLQETFSGSIIGK